jgi:outer membrane protein TolC
MRNLLVAGCITSLALVSPLSAQETVDDLTTDGRPEFELSLFEAVEMALRYNLQVRLNKLAPESSYESIDASRAQFDPTLIFDVPSAFGRNIQQGTNQLAGGDVISSETLRGGFTFQDRLEYGTDWSISWNATRSFSDNSFSNFNPSFNSQMNLNVTQPLLQGFGREVQTAQTVISQNNYEISQEQFRQQVWTTVRTVYRAYWALVIQEANLDTQVLALDLARQQFERNNIQVEIGTLAPIETIQAEQQVATAELTVTQARQALDDAEDDLKRLINIDAATVTGWEVNIVPTTDPPLDSPDVDLDDAIRTALNNDPALRQEMLRLDSQSLNLKVAADSLKPQLNFTGSLQLSGTGGDFLIRGSGFGSSEIAEIQEGGFGDALRNMMSGDFRNWSVGLQLRLPINNWAAKAQHAQQLIAEKQIVTRVADREQELRVNVTKAARQVTSGARQVAQARTARELAQRQLDAEQRKFAVGTTTNFEVLRFQRDLVTSQQSELSAILNYVNSLADLEQLKGTLLESLGVTFGIAGVAGAQR